MQIVNVAFHVNFLHAIDIQRLFLKGQSRVKCRCPSSDISSGAPGNWNGNALTTNYISDKLVMRVSTG